MFHLTKNTNVRSYLAPDCELSGNVTDSLICDSLTGGVDDFVYDENDF